MALAAGGWSGMATCPSVRFRPGLALCRSRFPGCGNEAGQKTIRGMVFPTNAPLGKRLTFRGSCDPEMLARLVRGLSG